MISADDPRHGTENGYSNLDCRCKRCCDARTAYLRLRKTGSYRRNLCACGREKRYASAQCYECYLTSVTVGHGLESRYTKGCRCDECRAAGTLARRRRRAKAAA